MAKAPYRHSSGYIFDLYEIAAETGVDQTVPDAVIEQLDRIVAALDKIEAKTGIRFYKEIDISAADDPQFSVQFFSASEGKLSEGKLTIDGNLLTNPASYNNAAVENILLHEAWHKEHDYTDTRIKLSEIASYITSLNETARMLEESPAAIWGRLGQVVSHDFDLLPEAMDRYFTAATLIAEALAPYRPLDGESLAHLRFEKPESYRALIDGINQLNIEPDDMAIFKKAVADALKDEKEGYEGYLDEDEIEKLNAVGKDLKQHIDTLDTQCAQARRALSHSEEYCADLFAVYHSDYPQEFSESLRSHIDVIDSKIDKEQPQLVFEDKDSHPPLEDRTRKADKAATLLEMTNTVDGKISFDEIMVATLNAPAQAEGYSLNL